MRWVLLTIISLVIPATAACASDLPTRARTAQPRIAFALGAAGLHLDGGPQPAGLVHLETSLALRGGIAPFVSVTALVPAGSVALEGGVELPVLRRGWGDLTVAAGNHVGLTGSGFGGGFLVRAALALALDRRADLVVALGGRLWLAAAPAADLALNCGVRVTLGPPPALGGGRP